MKNLDDQIALYSDVIRSKNIELFHDSFYKQSDSKILNSLRVLNEKPINTEDIEYNNAIIFLVKCLESKKSIENHQENYMEQNLKSMKASFDKGFLFQAHYYEMSIAQFCYILLEKNAFSLLEYFMFFQPNDFFPSFEKLRAMFPVIPEHPDEDKFDCNFLDKS